MKHAPNAKEARSFNIQTSGHSAFWSLNIEDSLVLGVLGFGALAVGQRALSRLWSSDIATRSFLTERDRF